MRGRWSLPVWKTMIAVGIFAVLLSFYIVPVSRLIEFARLARRMEDTIRALRPTDPRRVNSAVWQCAHNWTMTAYGNVCASPEHVATAEMYRLRDDLERYGKEDVDLKTLMRIWQRLGETGPHGKRYIEHYRPQFEACFPAGQIPRPSRR